MAGEIAYKLTADEAQALQAVARLSREFGLNETAIKKTVEAAKDLDRTQQQMGREGQRVFEETRTAAEGQAIALKRLGELYAANKIDAETYNRAVKQIEDQQKTTFGTEGESLLQNFAAGFLPAIDAATALKNVLGEIAEMKKQSAERDKAAEFNEGSLAELAHGDPEEFKQILATSRRISGQAGMDRQQAAKLTFALGSADMLPSADMFADAYKAGVIQDPENLLRTRQHLFKRLLGKGSKPRDTRYGNGRGEFVTVKGQ